MRLLKQFVRKAYAGTTLRFGGGLGDQLLCTTVAHELSVRGHGRIWILSEHPEIFRGNPAVTGSVPPKSIRAGVVEKLTGYERSFYLQYDMRDVRADVSCPPTEHIIATMCRQAGVRGDVRIRPYLFLNKSEIAVAGSYRGYLAIQSSGLRARHPIPNKEWYPDRFAEVAKTLLKRRDIVQIGSASDPAVPCSIDLRGKTSIRELAAVLANARLLVGLVGFPMHLARAVGCPAVVVYGGRERPDQSGYSCNVNLYNAVPCAPCWAYSRCDYERRCMAEIQPSDVLAGVAALLERPTGELACDIVQL